MHIARTEPPCTLVLLAKPVVDQVGKEEGKWRELVDTTFVRLVRTA
jgi:hypothetical protein